MTSLALKNNDFYFENYRIVFTKNNSDEILQRVRMRLKFFQGEWFLDTEHGIPYFQEILGSKSPDLEIIGGILKDAILDVEGVISLLETVIDIDKKTRRLLFSFKAQIQGDTIEDTINL